MESLINQKAWIKRYIDMNTGVKKLKMTLNNSVFGKSKENVRKNRHTKLVKTGKTRYYLLSKPNSHTTKFFSENIFVTKKK